MIIYITRTMDNLRFDDIAVEVEFKLVRKDYQFENAFISVDYHDVFGSKLFNRGDEIELTQDEHIRAYEEYVNQERQEAARAYHNSGEMCYED